MEKDKNGLIFPGSKSPFDPEWRPQAVHHERLSLGGFYLICPDGTWDDKTVSCNFSIYILQPHRELRSIKNRVKELYAEEKLGVILKVG